MKSLPAPRSRTTGLRWLRQHPGLGVTIGGRHFLYDAAVKAIGQGVPLADAARIGAGGERAA
jgi:alanine dehydrogenase